MSTRLPTPGGDNGDWGDILNAFLEVSHNSNGTLADNVVGTAQIQDAAVGSSQISFGAIDTNELADGAVTNAKLDSATQTAISSAISSSQLGAANGIATLNSSSQITSSQLPITVVQTTTGTGVIRSGTGPPASNLGNTNDDYIDVTNNLIYQSTTTTSYASFPSISVSDSFNRSPENPLSDSGAWTQIQFDSYPLAIVTTGQATSSQAGSGGSSIYTGSGSLTTTDVFCAIDTFNSSDNIIIFLRANASFSQGYRIKFGSSYCSVYLENGTSIATGNPTIAAGDSIGVRMTGATLTVYHQASGGSWQQVLTTTDSTYSSGYAGIGISSQNTSISSFGSGSVQSTSSNAWSSGLGIEIGHAFVVPNPTGVAATDHTNVQTQLTAAGSAGGGVVELGYGTYVTTQLTLPANVHLRGKGRAVTTIQLAPASNQDLLVTQGFSGYTGTTSNGPSGFSLSNLTLDANRANQTSLARCFVAYGYAYSVHNAWFINGFGGAIYSEWSTAASGSPMESKWTGDIEVYNYGGIAGSIGIDWNGPHDTQMSGPIVATLDSTIQAYDVAYGAQPINVGSTPTATIPSNSANGGSGSFTFTTTAAASTTLYPTTGGSFIVPSYNSLNTYGTITYTACSTTGGVTTFTGCTSPLLANRVVTPGIGSTSATASIGSLNATLSTGSAITTLPLTVGSNPLGVGTLILLTESGHTQTWTVTALATPGASSVTVTSQTPSYAFDSGAAVTNPVAPGIVVPSYGIRVDKGSGDHGETGLVLNSIHVWGRNHFALYGNTSIFATNAEIEGAMISNVVLNSTKNVFVGQVYGSGGQAGQTNELGIQLGSDTGGCGSSLIAVTAWACGGAYSSNGGCTVMTTSSSGGNQIKVGGSAGNPNKFVNIYSGSGDSIEATCQNYSTLSVVADYNLIPHHAAVFTQSRGTTTASGGGTLTLNCWSGSWQTITFSDTSNYTIANPTNTPGAYTQELTIEIYNNSGGTMGTISWGSQFLLLGQTITLPVSGKHTWIRFEWNTSSFVFMGQAPATY
jgi:hypothetical protein